MKKLDVPIDKYNWHLVVLIDVDIDNIRRVIQYLHYLYCDESYINDVKTSINNGYNNAITITNLSINRSLVIINKTTNDKEFVNSIVHECRHVQSHIATKYHLDEKGEDVAYLIGHIVSDIYYQLQHQHPSTGVYNKSSER